MLLRPWDFPGKSTGVGCHFLLQRIFPTQGSNLSLPHCSQMLYHLSHKGSPSSKKALGIPWQSRGQDSPSTAGGKASITAGGWETGYRIPRGARSKKEEGPPAHVAHIVQAVCKIQRWSRGSSGLSGHMEARMGGQGQGAEELPRAGSDNKKNHLLQTCVLWGWNWNGQGNRVYFAYYLDNFNSIFCLKDCKAPIQMSESQGLTGLQNELSLMPISSQPSPQATSLIGSKINQPKRTVSSNIRAGNIKIKICTFLQLITKTEDNHFHFSLQ